MHQACGVPAGTADPNDQQDRIPVTVETPTTELHETRVHQEGSPDTELRDPYLNPLEAIVLDTGTIPCSKFGYEHLARDPSCEFGKQALVLCIAILARSMACP